MKIPNKAPCEKVDGLFIDFVLSDYFFFSLLQPERPFCGSLFTGPGSHHPPAAPSPGSSSRRAGRNEKGMEKQEPPFRETFYF